MTIHGKRFAGRWFSSQRCKSSGLALHIILLIILAIAGAIGVIGMLGYIAYWSLRSPVAHTPDSIKITAGPDTIRPDVDNTYEVTVVLPGPISRVFGYPVVVQIEEDEPIWDPRLDESIVVSFRARQTSAKANFVLRCKDPVDDGDYELHGDNGFAPLEDVWEIYGQTQDQWTAEDYEGDNFALKCEEP